MSRFIRVATAGCFVLGLSLLFSPLTAQAKGGGGKGHGSSHGRMHGHRNHRTGHQHRRRNYRRYWDYAGYSYDDGVAAEAAPVAVADEGCGCMPSVSADDSYGGYVGYGRHYRNRRFHNRGVSHRGHRGRGGRGGRGGHGRK